MLLQGKVKSRNCVLISADSKLEFLKYIFRAGVGLLQRHPIAPVRTEAEYCIENSTRQPVTQSPLHT